MDCEETESEDFSCLNWKWITTNNWRRISWGESGTEEDRVVGSCLAGAQVHVRWSGNYIITTIIDCLARWGALRGRSDEFSIERAHHQVGTHFLLFFFSICSQLLLKETGTRRDFYPVRQGERRKLNVKVLFKRNEVGNEIWVTFPSWNGNGEYFGWSWGQEKIERQGQE